MSKQLKLRRGTTAQHSTFTGASGEVTVDTDKKTLVVHDGVTAGGNALVTKTGAETLTNKTLTTPVINGFTGDTSVVNLGSGQFYKDASGNVGIGTSSPVATLDVFGAINLRSGYNVTWGGAYAANIPTMYGVSGASPYIAWNVRGSSGESMRIDASGNVGIGTSSPGAKLHVSGNILAADGTNANYVEVRNGGNWTGRLTASAVGKLALQYYNGSAWVDGLALDSSGNISTKDGAGNVKPAYDCRAWVNFTGVTTTTIRASGNVSSLTDNGTGDTTINFTTAMSDTSYTVTGNTKLADSTATTNNSMILCPFSYATGSVRIFTMRPGDSLNDCATVNVAIFR